MVAPFKTHQEHTMTSPLRNAIDWFELPVAQFDRAVAFYETVLAAPLRLENMGDKRLAVFGYDESGVGGCLMEDAALKPAAVGALVYLNAGASIDRVLERVEHSGGRIALGKTALPPGMGFFAHIIDSENNRVGLHALA
jgi:predicted enzyme related to lactoylglutathione lyase